MENLLPEHSTSINSTPKFNNGRWVNGIFCGSDIQFSSGGWENYYPRYEKDLVSGYKNNLEATKKKEVSARDDETK